MRTHHRAMAAAMLLLGAGCSRTTGDPDEVARAVIGPGGGIISSLDSTLTLAIPPGALEENTEFFIERSNDPPDVYGQAYVVRPNPEPAFDITVTYRGELPADTSGLAVGAVDAIAYEEGRGQWQPLTVLRVDRQEKLVSGVDSRISIFYGLLDDGAQTGSVTSAGSATTTAGSGASASASASASAGTTDDPGTTTDDPGTTTDDPGTTTDDPGTTSDDPGTTTGEAAVSYAEEIEPILTANCNCHTAADPPEGLDLSDGYAGLVDVASNQAGLDRIEPGAPEDSYLWHKINDTHLGVGGQDNAMPPPDGGLGGGDIALIEMWILDGAEP